MRTVYGFKPSPFVRKVRIALAEKGLPYRFESATPRNPYGLGPFDVSPELGKISPLGKIPAYREGERALADSSVICAYLEQAYPDPALYPRDPYAYAQALWFEEYADTALSNVVTAKISVPRLLACRFTGRPPDEAAIATVLDAEVPPLFDYLDGELRDDEMLVGTDFSIADIAVATHFATLRYAGVEIDAARWPRLARYVADVLSRSSFHDAMEEELTELALQRDPSSKEVNT